MLAPPATLQPYDADPRLPPAAGGVGHLARTLIRTLVKTWGHASDAWGGARGCLLTFHRVAPPAAWEALPNRGFYIELTFLDRLLQHLIGGGWAVVTMDEALRRTAAGKRGDRFVNISIDDCYRDTFEALVPLFRRHGAPVTLFVTTGIPDGTLPMWAAGLEDTLLERDTVIIDGAAVAVATPDAKRAVFQRIAAAWDGPHASASYARFCDHNGIDITAMHWKHAITWEMLEALRHDALVEIGSHTINHPRVSSLSAEDALAELQGSRARLRERLDIEVRHFAFPYGRRDDCGDREFALARAAGYASCATTRKGIVRKGHDPYRLPRNTVNGMFRNLTTIELHLTGVTGAAAKVFGRV